MQARIAKRYAAERRFRLFGLAAVLASCAFLAFLLIVMVGNGARGFTYTSIDVPIDFAATPLMLDTSRLDDPDAEQAVTNAGLSDIVAFAADEALGEGGSALIAPSAWKDVRAAIIDDPDLLTGRTVFALPAASDVDMAVKTGRGGAKIAALEQSGNLSTGIHWSFFTGADATDPAAAGIWGALKGSVLTIFIAFIIAFPTGVLAALYLEGSENTKTGSLFFRRRLKGGDHAQARSDREHDRGRRGRHGRGMVLARARRVDRRDRPA